MMAKSKYEYESDIEEILDRACSDLNPADFKSLLDSVDMMLQNYEE